MSDYKGYGTGKPLSYFKKKSFTFIQNTETFQELLDFRKYRFTEKDTKVKRTTRKEYTVFQLHNGNTTAVHKFFFSLKSTRMIGHLNGRGVPCSNKDCPYLFSLVDYIYRRSRRKPKETITKWRVISPALMVNIYKSLDHLIYLEFKPVGFTGRGSYYQGNSNEFEFMNMNYNDFLIFVKSCPTYRHYHRKKKGIKTLFEDFEENIIENPKLLTIMSKSKLANHFSIGHDTVKRYIRDMKKLYPKLFD